MKTQRQIRRVLMRYDIYSGVQRAKTKTRSILSALIMGGAAIVMAGAVALPAFASPPSRTELVTNNWRVFNINRNVAKLWDINQAKASGDGIGFTFNLLPPAWYTAYLKTNYNVDLTGKTITAVTNWTSGALYQNRASSPASDAHFRIVFISEEGNYNSNSYWWNTGGNNLDLNAVSSGTLIGDLTAPAQWSNICGQSATDKTPHPGPNCIGGTDPAVSPADGFANAMKNVNEVGLSFGGGSFYANGVASTTSATFELSSFRVE